MEALLGKVKSGGKLSLVIFGVYIAFSISQEEGCDNIKDRINVEFGLEEDQKEEEEAPQEEDKPEENESLEDAGRNKE